MWNIPKINFLDIVKHDIAKTNIKNKLIEKKLDETAIRYVNRIIDCDSGRISYKVVLKDECFTIFDDGTELQ